MVSSARFLVGLGHPDMARRMGLMPPVRMAGAKSFGGVASAMIF
jgi:hypothetical protein